ncbi:MAG TPA: hypothetical protein VI685_20130 [Candidatus Angelobacter sp.]
MLLTNLARYFDINSDLKDQENRLESQSGRKLALGSKRRVTAWPQWLALFAGVLIQPFFHEYQVSRHWNFNGLGGWAIFSLIASILIFPVVYRTAFDDKKPVVVLLAPIFAAGLGWESLLATVLKAGEQVAGK